MARDPYVYSGSDVLINKEDIRDKIVLDQFERLMTAQRLAEGPPNVSITVDGYRQLHRHIFQDVYAWAGEVRTVDIAKDKSYFCRADFIDKELEKRFEAIRSENNLVGMTPENFADRAGEHLSELNAIHPFREGNGRAMRAFLEELGRQAGHAIDMERIDPSGWNEASRSSFQTGDTTRMREIVAGAIVSKQNRPEIARAAVAGDRLKVLDAATGAVSKLSDFVLGLLAGASRPTPADEPAMMRSLSSDPATRRRQRHANVAASRQAYAAERAIERIREDMEAGRNLKAEDIRSLTRQHQDQIGAFGDSAVRHMVDASRKRDDGFSEGRERERD